eukprot:scaffold32212_cov20-Tisochrysis_lutea.AAC.1
MLPPASTLSQTSSPEVGKVGGEAIAKQFPNPWQVSLGRVDSSEPGPNRAPPMDADVNEIRVGGICLSVWCLHACVCVGVRACGWLQAQP